MVGSNCSLTMGTSQVSSRICVQLWLKRLQLLRDNPAIP